MKIWKYLKGKIIKNLKYWTIKLFENIGIWNIWKGKIFKMLKILEIWKLKFEMWIAPYKLIWILILGSILYYWYECKWVPLILAQCHWYWNWFYIIDITVNGCHLYWHNAIDIGIDFILLILMLMGATYIGTMPSKLELILFYWY